MDRSPLAERERFENDVLAGLSATPKALPSVYLYDNRGTELFRRIMALPGYYPTRVERQILECHAKEIAAALGGLAAPCDLVDLGAGDGAKTRVLLARLHDAGVDVSYRPVDVSNAALDAVLDACATELPWLDAEGVVAEYADGIRWLAERATDRQRLVLLLGSNIGNLDDDEAADFLSELRGVLYEGDHVLVGFDLVKDVSVLTRAYDDAVTAEFNLNLLRRINRELAGTFDVAQFRHYATFAPARCAMESYLLATRRTRVVVAGRSFDFDAWEPLRTEISRKYRDQDIDSLARAAGFVHVARFTDERRYFVDALFRVGRERVQ